MKNIKKKSTKKEEVVSEEKRLKLEKVAQYRKELEEEERNKGASSSQPVKIETAYKTVEELENEEQQEEEIDIGILDDKQTEKKINNLTLEQVMKDAAILIEPWKLTKLDEDLYIEKKKKDNLENLNKQIEEKNDEMKKVKKMSNDSWKALYDKLITDNVTKDLPKDIIKKACNKMLELTYKTESDKIQMLYPFLNNL